MAPEEIVEIVKYLIGEYDRYGDKEDADDVIQLIDNIVHGIDIDEEG